MIGYNSPYEICKEVGLSHSGMTYKILSGKVAAPTHKVGKRMLYTTDEAKAIVKQLLKEKAGKE